MRWSLVAILVVLWGPMGLLTAGVRGGSGDVLRSKRRSIAVGGASEHGVTAKLLYSRDSAEPHPRPLDDLEDAYLQGESINKIVVCDQCASINGVSAPLMRMCCPCSCCQKLSCHRRASAFHTTDGGL